MAKRRIVRKCKITKDLLEEMEDIKETFETSVPEEYSEMEEAGRQARWYWDQLEKCPGLKKKGFVEEDVYDPTEE